MVSMLWGTERKEKAKKSERKTMHKKSPELKWLSIILSLHFRLQNENLLKSLKVVGYSGKWYIQISLPENLIVTGPLKVMMTK